MKPLLHCHVEKISIATKIELVALIHSNPTLQEKVYKGSVDDCRSDLALDIIPCNRQFSIFEFRRPPIVCRDELGNTVYEATARVQSLLRIESSAFFAPDRKVVDEDLCSRIFQLSRHIDRLRSVLVVDVERFSHVRGNAIQVRTRFDGDVHVGDIAYLRGAVWIGDYGLAKSVSDLI